MQKHELMNQQTSDQVLPSMHPHPMIYRLTLLPGRRLLHTRSSSPCVLTGISPTPGSITPTPGTISPTPGSITPTPGTISPTPGSISPTPGSPSPASHRPPGASHRPPGASHRPPAPMALPCGRLAPALGLLSLAVVGILLLVLPARERETPAEHMRFRCSGRPRPVYS
ncbi:hypothetical protein EYF80_058928 [Liparis tanakae]|uniref:Uncharacterized protein n=1 Tax=Liparis tanakae TaxID=230148 RepID=A0A4Z2EQ15_9TELE|nr:hypothetical protein EYF80_058928 [Liparis tanakae]